MAKNNGKVEIARKYVETHGTNKDGTYVADRTIARMIREEMPDKFDSIEDARRSVRAARGHKGEKMRRQSNRKDLHTPTTHDTHPTKHQKKDDQVQARVLLLDIETAPVRAFVFRLWKQNIGINQIDKDWFCLSWAAKWLFEPGVISERLTGKEALKQNDKRIIKSLHRMVNEADIIIAHNGDKFDIPKINTRFIVHGLNPPTPYQTIDTLKTLQRNFGFSSNKLDHVNRILNLRRKMDTGGFELWEKCYNGDEAALKLMDEYNIHDVRILEDLYLTLRPWIKPHPNLGLFILDKEERCPTCGSKELKEEGTYRTHANNFTALRCNNCGAIGRRWKSEVKITQKRHLIYSTPK